MEIKITLRAEPGPAATWNGGWLIEAEQLVGGRPGLPGSREISAECTQKVHLLPCPALPYPIQRLGTEN